MRTTRVFHSQPLADEREFELDAGSARHLTRVLRLRTGDAFVVFDGTGFDWPATLLEGTRARTGAGARVATESPLAVTLVQGISRGERMDWTLQKAVELGVSRVVPVVAERTTVRLDGAREDKRLAHWRGVMLAACEQSGRSIVPALAPITTFTAWLAGLAGPALVLDPDARDGLAAQAGHAAAFTLVVGPEGGLSAAELAAARAAGCTAVRIGPRVLRTETAGVAALAALQTLFGDLSN